MIQLYIERKFACNPSPCDLALGTARILSHNANVVEQGSEIAVSATRVAKRIYRPKTYTSKLEAHLNGCAQRWVLCSAQNSALID